MVTVEIRATKGCGVTWPIQVGPSQPILSRREPFKSAYAMPFFRDKNSPGKPSMSPHIPMPFAPRNHPAVVLQSFTSDHKAAVLDAAGEERLRRKADRMRNRIEEVGVNQALYEEILTALGYKHNKRAFRTLAGHIPYHLLRDHVEGKVLHAYAILCGVSGLLPMTQQSKWSAQAQRFIRQVWDIWWREQETWGWQRMHNPTGPCAISGPPTIPCAG